MKYNKTEFIMAWLKAHLGGPKPKIEVKEIVETDAKYRVCIDGLILPNGDVYDRGSTFWAPVLPSETVQVTETKESIAAQGTAEVVVENETVVTPVGDVELTEEAPATEEAPEAPVAEKPAPKKSRAKK